MPTRKQLLAIIGLQTDIAKQGLDLGGTMALVVQRVLPLLDADGAAIELADGQDMIYRAVSGIATQALGLRIPVATSLSGRCMTTGQPLRCDDAETDARVDRQACRQVGLRAMVVVPLRFNDTPVGVLKAMSKHPRFFKNAHVSLLATLSEVVAASMYFSTRYNRDELFLRATQDSLTGVANKAMFMDRLHNVIAQHARDRQAFGLLIADIDGLKSVNDTLGHRAGDALIVEFAQRLQKCARLTDTVARLGGDEFGVILSPVDEVKGFNAIAQRYGTEMSGPMRFEGGAISLAGSVGLAHYPQDGADIETLLDIADRRMYAVKRQHHERITAAA